MTTFVTLIKWLAPRALVAYVFYQPTITALINHFAWDARLLRDQLKTIRDCDEKWQNRYPGAPVQHDDSPIYVPYLLGPGEDISIEEARSRLARLDERLATLRRFSPLHYVLPSTE